MKVGFSFTAFGVTLLSLGILAGLSLAITYIATFSWGLTLTLIFVGVALIFGVVFGTNKEMPL